MFSQLTTSFHDNEYDVQQSNHYRVGMLKEACMIFGSTLRLGRDSRCGMSSIVSAPA
jgi:hypothetical protein